ARKLGDVFCPLFLSKDVLMLRRIPLAVLPLLVAGVFLSQATVEAQTRAPKVLARGKFHKVEEPAKGQATVYKLADGRRILRLSNFESANGPDLRVRLIAADNAKDTASVARAEYVELGKLKGNRGNQNYQLPRDLDLGKYRL